MKGPWCERGDGWVIEELDECWCCMAGSEGADMDMDVWYEDMSCEYCGGGSSFVDGEL